MNLEKINSLLENALTDIDSINDYRKDIESASSDIEDARYEIERQNEYISDAEDTIDTATSNIEDLQDSVRCCLEQVNQLLVEENTNNIGNEDQSKEIELLKNELAKYKEAVANCRKIFLNALGSLPEEPIDELSNELDEPNE